MRKFILIAFMVTAAIIMAIPYIHAMAEGETGGETSTPYTWEYLGTIAGATAATLLIVQFAKMPLDRVWKIPTRLFVYVIALLISLAAAAFTHGVTTHNVLLIMLNAVVVAVAAYGTYEITFKKIE